MDKIKPRVLIDNLINKFGEFSFGLSIDPTTGKPMPNIGGTLKITETDRRRALKLVAELEKRRILYETLHNEQVDISIKSVIEIREFINKEIIIYKRKSRLSVYAKELIEACQEFLNLTQRLNEKTGNYYTLDQKDWQIFRAAIKRLRKVFAKWLYQIVTEYDIEIEKYLARIIPVSMDHDPNLLADVTQ